MKIKLIKKDLPGKDNNSFNLYLTGDTFHKDIFIEDNTRCVNIIEYNSFSSTLTEHSIEDRKPKKKLFKWKF